MTNMPNHSEGNQQSSSLDPLHALNSIHLPDGLQSRITERLHQMHAEHPAGSLKRYTRELWTGAAIGAAAVIAICCFLALHSNRAATTPLAVNVPRNIIPIIPATAPQAVRLTQQPARAHTAHSSAPPVLIPQPPPPLPLTQQERLLLALASKPSLAAVSAVSQPVADHGLGANSIFDLDHEQLIPLQPQPLESTPLPPALSDPTFSGETK